MKTWNLRQLIPNITSHAISKKIVQPNDVQIEKKRLKQGCRFKNKLYRICGYKKFVIGDVSIKTICPDERRKFLLIRKLRTI